MEQSPDFAQAVVPREKVTGYLLAPDHPDGRSKAAFFMRFGFSAAAWEELAEALKHHARVHEAKRSEITPYGTSYVAEGILRTPDRRNPHVRTVWFVETGQSTPRFVTAYPL